MNVNQLTENQRQLLNTDFGDLEKEAEARLETVQEMYAYGHNKLAFEIADNLDSLEKQAQEEEEGEEEDKKEMDEESEKAAAEMGAFIERGVFDGLAKLGSERHNDSMHYFYPFMEEKIAAGAVMKALSNFGKKVQKGTGAATKYVSGKAGKAKKYITGKAKQLGGAMAADYRAAKDLGGELGRAGKKAITGKGPKGGTLTKAQRQQAKTQALAAGKALGKTVAPYAAGTGVAGGGAYLAMRGGKKED